MQRTLRVLVDRTDRWATAKTAHLIQSTNLLINLLIFLKDFLLLLMFLCF